MYQYLISSLGGAQCVLKLLYKLDLIVPCDNEIPIVQAREKFRCSIHNRKIINHSFDFGNLNTYPYSLRGLEQLICICQLLEYSCLSSPPCRALFQHQDVCGNIIIQCK